MFLAIDIESTGVDVSKDRIIELGLSKSETLEGERYSKRYLLFPGMAIPAEASLIHGYRDEDVADCPSFKDVAHEIFADFMIGVQFIVGYNAARFDVPMLWEEFYRAGLEWDWTGAQVIDPLVIWTMKEPRTLKEAVKKFCDRELEGAHGAVADVGAALDVLQGERAYYPDLADLSPDELARLSRYDDDVERVDLAGKLVKNPNGDVVYNFGKHKGRRVRDEPGYADWMLRNEFSVNTKMALERELVTSSA